MEFDAYLEQLQAEAEHQGSGAFTCDLNRMQKVLGAFQLATPEEYVLPVLCAAVLNCASWFRLEEQEGATVLSWDGPPLTLAQLHQLLPSLTQPGSLLGELAVGLLAARRLGEVCLQSSHGQFHFRGQQVVVETLGRDGPNLMTLRRKWWCRLLRRSRISAQILRDRCRFAPLQLTPHQAPEAVTAPLVLCAGHTRADWLTAEEWVDLPDCPWGRGLLYLGQAPWQVIRHGVTYTLPSPLEGVVAVWWSDALPLDLSRKELQRGPEFEAWLSWLHEQLSSLVITRNLTEQLASLVKSGLNSNQSLFIDAPLFRCADGSYTSLAAIRADYREHGWLPTVTRPMLLGWEPQRVAVVEKPHEQALCKIFPNWLKLDHLENETNLPRLPEDEEYVVRIPCLIGRGEAGLRRYPSSFAFRQFSYGQWQELRSLLFGVDVARESLESGVLPIGELYWTLQFITLGDTFAHLWDLHMLVMLGWLKWTPLSRQ